MEHVAIMKKSWGLTAKILRGEKKIESRWYLKRRSPWDKIKKDETVYFKDSGEPVSVRAQVDRVMQIDALTPSRVGEILNKYGDEDGLAREDIPEFFKRFKDKKYCLLVFLKNPQRIKPFNINKAGFGTMSAWITTENVSKIINIPFDKDRERG